LPGIPKGRIRTPYAAAPCSSVTRIARKDLEKYDLRDAGAIRARFSLILGKRALTPIFVLSRPNPKKRRSRMPRMRFYLGIEYQDSGLKSTTPLQLRQRDR
jgi:hypothetical protein